MKIRQWVLEGRTQAEIAQLSQIPLETIEHWIWRNYQGFADCWRLYKMERRLLVAEQFGDNLMFLPDEDKEIIKLKQKEAEFVRETAGKAFYSKRSELTGKDGGAIEIKKIEDLSDEELDALIKQ